MFLKTFVFFVLMSKYLQHFTALTHIMTSLSGNCPSKTRMSDYCWIAMHGWSTLKKYNKTMFSHKGAEYVLHLQLNTIYKYFDVMYVSASFLTFTACFDPFRFRYFNDVSVKTAVWILSKCNNISKLLRMHIFLLLMS